MKCSKFSFNIYNLCMAIDTHYQVEDVVRQKRVDIEEENDDKIAALREKLDGELQETQEDMEKKHAYQLEQLRQELLDKHERVCCISFP